MSLTNLPNNYFTSINDFIMEEDGKTLGSGSFGIVKLAYHKTTNKIYAIKIVDISEMEENDPELLLLEREISIHYQLRHPHIVQLWAVILHEKKVYMIMDYAENGNLFTLLSNPLLTHTSTSSPGGDRFLTEIEAFKIFSQVLEAVEYMHKMDVFHRDIKPENILLDHHYNIKLCDFGWVADQTTRKRNTFCGTYEYMAPEMVQDVPYDYKIDIWALGILLFELTHGRPPFPANSLETIKYRFEKGTYDIKETLSQEFKKLIVSVLQFEPDKRIELQEIKKSEWFNKYQTLCENDIKIGISQGVSKFTLKRIKSDKNFGNLFVVQKSKEDKIRKYHKKYHTLEEEDFHILNKNVKMSKHGSMKSNLNYTGYKENYHVSKDSGNVHGKNWVPHSPHKEKEVNVYLKETINRIAQKEKKKTYNFSHLCSVSETNENVNKKISKLILEGKNKNLNEGKKKRPQSKRG